MDTVVGTYPVGIQPMARFPKTKTPFLEALGETAVDFDFAPPEWQGIETVTEKTATNTVKDTTVEEKTKDFSITCDICNIYFYSDLCRHFSKRFDL